MAETTTNVPGRIFISYRRQDSAYAAGWLFDRLAERLGPEQIFKDVDSIDFGDDFVEEIGAAVGSTDVLLALIGDKWLAVADEHGARRLDDPEDFVRIEIEAALTRNVRVIPILVEGARMPREDELPPDLQPLARRQAMELSPARFASDSDRLLRALERALAEAHTPQGAPSAGAAAGPEPPKAAEMVPAASVTVRGRRTRPLVVTLALAGAGVGVIANFQHGNEVGAFRAFAPMTVGVPVLAAACAVLLQAGRVRERLAYGWLLGLGLMTTAAAVGLWSLLPQLGGDQGSVPLVLFCAGALILAAGLLGSSKVARSAGAWDVPFRWGPASLLAVLGALVTVAALFVSFGKDGNGNPTTVRDLAANVHLTGIVLEPIVAIAMACIATYALGKGGGVGLLAAGVVLALGAQTVLFYSCLLAAILVDYRNHWDGAYPQGFVVGFAAAGLLLAAGLLGRRSP